MTADIEAEFHEALARAPERARQAVQALAQGLVDRRIFIGARPVVASLKPHFLPHAMVQRWAPQAEQIIALINRIAPQVLRAPELYHRLGLLPKGRRHLAIDPGYPELAVLCRPDGVYDGDELHLLELNADCPAGAARNDRLQELVLSRFPMRELAERWEFSPARRTRGLYDALIVFSPR